MTRLGYLGLGSNVGDRRANLQAAVEDLWGHHVEALASSSVYETAPVGGVEQADFLNACLRVETELAPHAILHVCKAVERALGRELEGAGHVRWGPRSPAPARPAVPPGASAATRTPPTARHARRPRSTRPGRPPARRGNAR